MSLSRSLIVVCACLALFVAGGSFAQQTSEKPFLHPLFTDNMVLQRDNINPVWGWTTPGAKVTVTMNGRRGTGIADSKGKWVARIGKFPAGGPFTMEIAGPQTVTLKNVMVGDVWICSGQSNMEMGISDAKDGVNQAKAAIHPNLRLFNVAPNPQALPSETLKGEWKVCSPENITSMGNWHGFSAVGYFFGRALLKDLKVPIGLIQVTRGGTIARSWMSIEALETIPGYRKQVNALKTNLIEYRKPDYSFDRLMSEWWNKNYPPDQYGIPWSSPEFDDSSWKSIEGMPSNNYAKLQPHFPNGVIWLRRTFEVPKDMAGKEANLNLGTVTARETTWVNGHQVGSASYIPRFYRIPAGVLKEGKNVVTIGALSDSGILGFFNIAADNFGLQIADKKISLAGTWKYLVQKELKNVAPFPEYFNNNINLMTSLYNGMIAPLGDFGVKGVIWYQGESDALTNAALYRELLPALITDWRGQFINKDMPFIITQLTSFGKQTDLPVEEPSNWAELREAQLLTWQKMKNTGMAVIIDIGNPSDIHPLNKLEVGNRMALSALGEVYGKKIEFSGPVYRSMKVEDNKVRLTFDHAGGGLVAKGDEKLKGFAIAGEDKKFYHADAVIDGNQIVVSSPSVAQPVAVRYAWKNSPDCNLFNAAGLPASPFRTDVPEN